MPTKKELTKTQCCTKCKSEFPMEKRINTCPKCGGGLEFKIKEKFDFQEVLSDKKSMWRYENLLPIQDKENIVSLGEGYTPVIELPEIGKALGISLFAKLETVNPTGTFKDREASLVVSRSKEIGDDNLVFQSTGNTGSALTFYSGLAGLKSFFFCPLISKYKLIMPEKKPDNKIILIDGTNLEVKQFAEKFTKLHAFKKVSPFHERCEANIPQAYEQFEQIGSIDYYFQTMAAGMGPIGFYLGHKRLIEWGIEKPSRLPKIVPVQISEFSSIVRGWMQGKKELSHEDISYAYPENVFEPTLFTTNAPYYYPFVCKAVTKSKGFMLEVTPSYVESKMEMLATALAEKGFPMDVETEKAGFVGFAGLFKAFEQKKLPKGSRVLLSVTGRGAHVAKRIEPDAIIKPSHDPKKLLSEMQKDLLVRDVQK